MAYEGQFKYDKVFYERVLSSSLPRFIDDLDPVALLDAFASKQSFTFSQDRDIRELPLTSEKTRAILRKVSSMGRQGYQQFKTCLTLSYQDHLVIYLNEQEAVVEAEIQTKNLGVLTEKELLRIADNIGMNWEMLGPFLRVPVVKIDQIKLDNHTSEMQIYKMLLLWSVYNESAATKQRLYSDLKRAPTCVNIDWSSLESQETRDDQDTKQQVSLAHGPTNTTPIKHGDVLPNIQSEISRTQTPAISHAYKLDVPSVSGELPNQMQSALQRDEATSSSETIHSSLFPGAFGNVRMQGPYESNVQAIDQHQDFNVQDGQVSSRQQTTSTPSTTYTSNQQDAAHDSVDAFRNDKLLNDNLPGRPAIRYSATPREDSMQDGANVQQMVNDPLTQIEEGVKALRASSGMLAARPMSQQMPIASQTKIMADSIPASCPTFVNAIPNNNNDEQDGAIGVRRDAPTSALRECAHDGRLLIPSIEEVKKIIAKSDKPKLPKSGVGIVYFHKKKIAGLGIPIVVKEIECKEHQKQKVMSITNEKLASRTMHFAVVPLLAMTEDVRNCKVYFLTPYLENGDLNDAIKKDTEMIDKHKVCSDDIKLSKFIRLRILYQINCALQYLHTAVPGYRGPIIHMDVKSANIVLDGNFNARLIDFGLAREMDEMDAGINVTSTEVFGTKGYHPTVSYSRLTTADDYHNFGIVIRELLTGKPAYDEDNPEEELRKQDSENIDSNIQTMWYNQMDLSKEASTLNDISKECIEKTMKSNVVYEKLEDLLSSMCQDRWVRRDTDSSETYRCEMCMVNTTAKVSKAVFGHSGNCACPIRVCVACMRNSFLNPIVCHSCSGTILPCIGHGMGAILIAGNDEDEKIAQIFSQDIANVHHVLVSKCPLVMGISEDYTQIVQPTKPGTDEDMLQKVIGAFDHLKSKGDIHTVLIYFSGHHVSSNGFRLGKMGDFLSVERLKLQMQELMASYSTGSRPYGISERRFFVFLDCCTSPDVLLPTLSNGTSLSIVQINSCRITQTAESNDADGSVFSKLFEQALTRRALGRRCINVGCDECNDMKGEFITVEQLFRYVTKHMQDYCKNRLQVAQPVINVQQASWHDLSIAYVVDFPVDLEFKVKGCPEREKVPQQIYFDIHQLKIYLFGKLMAKMKPGHQFNVDQLMDFAESTCIEINKGPKVTKELDSIEKVMAAWNSRRELLVSLRTVRHISRGMVQVSTPVGDINTYIKNSQKEPKMEDEKYLTRVIIPYSCIDDMVTDLKFLKGSLGSLKNNLVNIRQGIKNDKNVEPEDKKTEIHFLFPKDDAFRNVMYFQLKHLKFKE